LGPLLACDIFDADAAVQALWEQFPTEEPCPPETDLPITRVSEHFARFTTVNGDLGAAYLRLPPGGGDAGEIDVLICRPGAGLSEAQCEVIVNDYVARNLQR
jgi:hypothetical protein